MKKLLILFMVISALFVQAQENRKSIAVNYGLGAGNLFRYAKVDGGGSDEQKSFYTIGLNYWTETNTRNLYFETGIQYLSYEYTLRYIGGSGQPGEEDREIKLLSIPVMLKYDIGKHLFFNGGLSANLDMSKDYGYTIKEFTGIGAAIGVGMHYYLGDKIGIYVNPQIDARNLLSFATQNMPERLLNTSFVFGLAYKIK